MSFKQDPKRAVRGQRARASGIALTLALATSASALAQEVEQQSPWLYDQEFRVNYEVDDNVTETLAEPVNAQVARLAYRGDLRWGSPGLQRLSMSFQGGFKSHFGNAISDLGLANQVVGDGTVGYQRRVTDKLALGANASFRGRFWTNDQFFFINEDGFRRLAASGGATVNLSPLAPENAARLEFGGWWSDIEFDNLDQQFGNDIRGAYASINKTFSPDITGTFSYTFDRVHFPGRGVLTPDDDDPLAAFRSPTRPRQIDHMHQLGTIVTWLGAVSVQGEYWFRYSDSNSYGFSYVSHQFGLQVLRRLPWQMLFQFYGQLELRDFLEPAPNLTGGGSLDTGDADNNVFLLRLVKDMAPNYSLEARYGRYRNESITLNRYYSKNIISVGVNYSP